MRSPDIPKEGIHRHSLLGFVFYQPAKLRFIRESPIGRKIFFESDIACRRAIHAVELIALAVSRIEDRGHDQNRGKEHDQDSMPKRLNELTTRTGSALVTHGAT